MLTTRRFVAAALAATVAALTAVTTGPAPAAVADPPGTCGIATCPTDPPSNNPTPPPIPPVFQPTPSSCEVLPLPVSPVDLLGLTPPPAIPGAWVYQLCGDRTVLVNMPASVRASSAAIKDYCESRACSIVPFWKASDPNQNQRLPVPDDPSGFGRFFQIWPDAQSVPVNGDAITNFPTWFFDNNHPLGVIPVPIPPIPLIGFGGAAATAIHLNSWWEVDGRRVCDNKGVKLTTINRQQAIQEHDCGVVFKTTGPHNATARERWLIIIVNAFPPAIVVFTITLSDNVNNLHAREVQSAN